MQTQSALLLILLTLAQYGRCQVTTSRTLMADLALKLTYRPQLDSSINVNSLSREQGNRLIKQMYIIDQQYRREIGGDMSRRDDQAKKAWRLMAVNDQSNQAILLKILNRFGWPCNGTDRQLGTKVYWIAWHARNDYDTMNAFYPYIQKAARQHCLPVTLEQEYRTWLAGLKRTYQR